MPAEVELAAQKARDVVDVPWDEVREARVHRRALEAFRANRDAPQDCSDELDSELDEPGDHRGRLASQVRSRFSATSWR